MARQRLTTAEAAKRLGISPDAVRKRASRGQLDSEKTADGKLYIWMDTDTPTQDSADERDRLIEFLYEQLEHEREVNRENRRIIAGLVQRIPELEPAADASPEARESPVTASEGEEAPPDGAERRPSWWRRLFG